MTVSKLDFLCEEIVTVHGNLYDITCSLALITYNVFSLINNCCLIVVQISLLICLDSSFVFQSFNPFS